PPYLTALVEDPPLERRLGALELAQRFRHRRAAHLVLGLLPRPLLERPSQHQDGHQRISFLSMNRIASRQATSAKPIRKARWPMSTQPSKPKTAWRTSSTQWYSGLTLAAI